MGEIGFSVKGECMIMCDNRATIRISENSVQHDQTKHVQVDRHFIMEKLEDKIIVLTFVHSEDQLAYILTQTMSGRKYREVLCQLNIGYSTIPLKK